MPKRKPQLSKRASGTPKYQRITTYMDPVLKARFTAFCASERRSQVRQLEIILTDYMDRCGEASK